MSWADTRYHPEGACAFCGHTEGLKRTWMFATRARAWRCVDVVECVRRLVALGRAA